MAILKLGNAPADSFFASLKPDLVRGRRFATHTEGRAALFDYIETFYDRRLRHSSLGYLTPAEYEERRPLEPAQLLAADLNWVSASAGADQRQQ